MIERHSAAEFQVDRDSLRCGDDGTCRFEQQTNQCRGINRTGQAEFARPLPLIGQLCAGGVAREKHPRAVTFSIGARHPSHRSVERSRLRTRSDNQEVRTIRLNRPVALARVVQVANIHASQRERRDEPPAEFQRRVADQQELGHRSLFCLRRASEL